MDTCDDQRRMVLQRVITTRALPVRDLYWRSGPVASRRRGGQPESGADRKGDPVPDGRPVADASPEGALVLAPHAVLRFDTYFSGFFEQHWRLHTRLSGLRLSARIQGRCTIRLFRQTDSGVQLLHEALHDSQVEGHAGCLDSTAVVEVAVPPETLNFRQHGLLWFEVAAHDAPVRFEEAAWTADAAEAAPVGLGVVFCTFNREADIGRVLAALVSEQPVLDRLARVFVVSQGRAGLAQHPAVQPLAARYGDKLRIVEQANFGGAGGFGRGLLEALDDPAVSHVAFLDDDIQVEPDSLLRMASFFALARGDVPVGGHMLDSVQPTLLYEAGAVIRDKDWTFAPQHHGLDIADPDRLAELIGPRPIHYNGWWCFGFPKHLARREGMPLPCFIRGDDVEFGLRLYHSGAPTVALPGVAVWHEPFYLKIGGWQLYYETRNMLVAAARHDRFDGRGVARRMLRHLLLHLLTFRYYGAALIVRGIEDFLRGPAILEGPPQALHASLSELRTAHPAAAVPRGQVLEPAKVPKLPHGRPGYLLALARVLLHNLVAPTRPARPEVMAVRDFAWVTLERHDSIALETWWDQELPRYDRSREHFRHLARRGGTALLQLYRRAPELRVQWRTAFPRLTSEASWRAYLGLAPGAGPGTGGEFPTAGADAAAQPGAACDHTSLRKVSEPA